MIAIGEVVGAYGRRGELRVQPLTDFPERFRSLEGVWLHRPDGTLTRDAVVQTREHETKTLIVLRLKGVRSREAAQGLVGSLLEVPEEEAVELEEGTYFEHDIMGLTVVTTDGRELGTIQEIIHTGANDVYVTPQCLIPAIADVVLEVDLEAGRMVIEPMPGLLGHDAD